MYGWEGMGVQALRSLSMSEVREVRETLRDVAWREVVDSWREEAGRQSKLVEVKKCKAQCIEVKCKRRRKILAKLRGGTEGLEVETGRWWGVSREEWMYRNCQSGEVEDVEHLVIRCTSVAGEREKLMRLMREKVAVAVWVMVQGDNCVGLCM